MKLPAEFINKMQSMLGEIEYQQFLKSYDEPRYYGLRVNTLKISVEEFLKITPFKLEPIPWTKDGFYYSEGDNPGRHPYYNAGLYYVQEPSAMLPGEVIEAKPGEYILDLCAAPGGKTVQIAAGMKGQGLLVANDINAERVRVLIKNIELYGVRNVIVTNEYPSRLAERFIGYFDKILIDAPCSGEGMFRKDEEAVKSWEKFKCEKCEGMQWGILENVDKMLKPGGSIVYSTCTFAPEEDERMMSKFLNKYNEYEILEINKTAGIENGRPEWSDGNVSLANTARAWPHKVKGEGHFVALLKKMSLSESTPLEYVTDFKNKLENQLALFRKFENDSLNINIDGNFDLRGNNLYNLPVTFPDISGIKVAKFGLYMGEITNERFEPSHSLAVTLKKENIKNTIDLDSNSREVASYLKGETVMIEGKKGLAAVCVDGYTLGWGKQSGDMIKNLYPKGWRRMR